MSDDQTIERDGVVTEAELTNLQLIAFEQSSYYHEIVQCDHHGLSKYVYIVVHKLRAIQPLVWSCNGKYETGRHEIGTYEIGTEEQ